MSLIVLAVIFFIIALVAYLLGANNIAGVSVEIGKILLWVAVAILLIVLIFSAINGGTYGWHTTHVTVP